jgi:hypothetical protein
MRGKQVLCDIVGVTSPLKCGREDRGRQAQSEPPPLFAEREKAKVRKRETWPFSTPFRRISGRSASGPHDGALAIILACCKRPIAVCVCFQ